jgi:hypothetical protein
MSAPKVQSYRFGRMVVDGRSYSNDLILLPDGVISNWWRDEGHRLSAADLEDVFDARPEVLVVGTGASGLMKVPQEIREVIKEAGIDLRIAKSGRAWELYNDLQEQQPTAGAFHLTC